MHNMLEIVSYIVYNKIKITHLEFGDIAQLGEHGVRNAEVGGSIPPISIAKYKPIH